MASTNPLIRALKRWGASNDELEAQERQRLAQAAGATQIHEAADRQRVRLRGFVTVLTLKPRSGTPWMEAQFSDGSDVITLIWMGRREIPGVVAGCEMAVEGRVSYVDGVRRFYNPRYEMIAGA